MLKSFCKFAILRLQRLVLLKHLCILRLNFLKCCLSACSQVPSLLDLTSEYLNRALFAPEKVLQIMGFLHFFGQLINNLPWFALMHLHSYLCQGLLVLGSLVRQFDILSGSFAQLGLEKLNLLLQLSILPRKRHRQLLLVHSCSLIGGNGKPGA